ncbi:MAG: DUF3052 domain-containing protein [Bacteroidia bacterium]
MNNALYKKLGIKEGFTLKLVNQPLDYYLFFDEFPDQVSEAEEGNTEIDFIHLFIESQKDMIEHFPALAKEIRQNGMIWVSWIKKSANIPTDVDGNFVREFGLSTKLVDCKVCSINEKWSAMKFVIRIKDRVK